MVVFVHSDIAQSLSSGEILGAKVLKLIRSSVLNSYAPNLIAIAGTTVSAQLISHVGSLKKLAFLPSSTIQILGAEKSLFRHLRGNGRCPKHGYLFNNAMVQSSSNKGKMARQLACKISICARVDLNHGNFIADKLIKEIK